MYFFNCSIIVSTISSSQKLEERAVRNQLDSNDSKCNNCCNVTKFLFVILLQGSLSGGLAPPQKKKNPTTKTLIDLRTLNNGLIVFGCLICVGPLFSFDVHDDIRITNDASVEKDEVTL